MLYVDNDDIRHPHRDFEVGKQGLALIMQMKLFLVEGEFVAADADVEGVLHAV
jgi:hypothetical protein